MGIHFRCLICSRTLGNWYKPIYGWDSRGHRLHHQYDAVRHPTQLSVSKSLVERLAEQVIYGEG